MTTPTDDTTTREEVLACLDRLEGGFRRRWDNNPDFRKSLKGKDRDILVDLSPTGTWTIEVRNGDLAQIREGRPEDPDVRIIAQADDFIAVFDGTLSPIEAYMKKKVKVKAGIRDIMLVKSFMGG